MQAVANDYVEAGKPELAIPLFAELAHREQAAHGATSVELAHALAFHGLALLKSGAFDKAEPILRTSVGVYDKVGPNSYDASYAKSLLGGATLGPGEGCGCGAARSDRL